MNVKTSDKAPYKKTNFTRNCNVDINLGGKLNTKKKVMATSKAFSDVVIENNFVFFFPS